MQRVVLVTGGAGYIGSSVCHALADTGHRPIVLDSFVRGRREFVSDYPTYAGDIADRGLMRTILREHPDLWAVVHMAAHTEVPESMARPLAYYDNNVSRTLVLLEELTRAGIERVIFSSSASIYQSGDWVAVTEDSPISPGSPYARSKWMIEQILDDVGRGAGARSISLRYFNPIGADPALRSGPYAAEPSHVLGRIMDALVDADRPFSITGTDYPTRDGTGVRDYIHVWDVARAHVAAVNAFDKALPPGRHGNLPINIGSGNGVTVAELVEIVREVGGTYFDVGSAPRRSGDVAGAYAVTDRARYLLGWTPWSSVADAVRSAMEWQRLRNA